MTITAMLQVEFLNREDWNVEDSPVEAQEGILLQVEFLNREDWNDTVIIIRPNIANKLQVEFLNREDWNDNTNSNTRQKSSVTSRVPQ